MTDSNQTDGADRTPTDGRAARPAAMTDRSPPSRRRLLGAVGTLLTVGVAGCTGGPSQPTYERRTVDVPEDAEPRTPAELSVATQLALTETSDAVAPLDVLDITAHEFVFESGYLGATVQGTVENHSQSRVDTAEVRVRVYNDADRLLGQYLARVSALDAGEEWSFTAIVLQSPSAIAAYDIAVLGTPV